MEDEKGQFLITELNPSSSSMVAATVGRVMNTLLSARPKHLVAAISRLDLSSHQNPNPATLENSLWILFKYISESANKEEPLDEVLVPMIEHTLKHKDTKYKNQEMVLLDWLFQHELLFQALARSFTIILLKKDDRYIAMGWCILTRALVEYENNQFMIGGVKKRYSAILKIFCSCVTRLLSIVRSGSTLPGGYELPTRLSLAAADCFIALTVALAKVENVSDISSNDSNLSKPYAKDPQSISALTSIGQKKVKSASQSSELRSNMEMRLLLWNLLDDLIMLVQRLQAWSRKSRSLHAKGLERVLKWLHEIKQGHLRPEDEAGVQIIQNDVLLLTSCWKHYGILLHLEIRKTFQHKKELLEQYLSGMQYFADNYANGHNQDSKVETINFFLNCLLLILGHFTGKQLESAMTEYQQQISCVSTSLLCSADEDVIDGAVFLLKTTIFGANLSAAGCGVVDPKHMSSILPLLLNLLDERDSAARAVVSLVAEYCSVSSESYCIEEVLKRLATGNLIQKRNAIDVISALVHIVVDSETDLADSTWRNITKHLLDSLKDDELVIRSQAAKLIPMIEPSLSLPALVLLICSSDGRLLSLASTILLNVLKNNNKNSGVICLLLECLSNCNENLVILEGGDDKRGLKLDTDKVLKLIPEWSKSVEDWSLLVGPLVDKMFAEPSNAAIVRFLSIISANLAGVVDVVFEHLLLHVEGRREIDESFFTVLENKSDTKGERKPEHSLFDRLCPLLILKMLPLRVFDDLKFSLVYGDLLNRCSKLDIDAFNSSDINCIASLIFRSAFNKFEFEDVRKLAAELCGRLHPHVLLPILSSQLGYATDDQDLLKIKTCLFSICTSLVVRGRDSVSHPALPRINKTIENILLWPSMDGDEISKAQHGCIDCFALMICAESQNPVSARDANGNAVTGHEVYNYVINQLTCEDKKVMSSKLDTNRNLTAKLPLSFRLCMANVLISACQKISDSGKESFAQLTLPRLKFSVKTIDESDIRAACLQVLFSCVYHLKSAILPYAPDLLKVAVDAFGRESEKERMAGAKLMASLMASEEAIVESIAEGLLEARTLLLSMSLTDSSPDLRQMCTKLLVCMTSP